MPCNLYSLYILKITEQTLIEIDQFLADPDKILADPQPNWVHQTGYHDWQLTWPVSEETTGITRASLKLRIPENDFWHPSISLIFRDCIVMRLDKIPDTEKKSNPMEAQTLGLPAEVSGTHIHDWADNRDMVLRRQSWQLPIRRAIDDRLRQINDMYFWFCDRVRIRKQDDSRRLDLPPQNLFGGVDV